MNIFGIHIQKLSRLELIEKSILDRKNLLAINSDKIIDALNSFDMKNLLNNNITYCDGIGIVKFLNIKYSENFEKIPGCELWLDILNYLAENNKKVYIIGGDNDLIQDVASKLKSDFGQNIIAGWRNGFFSNTDEPSIILEIKKSNADYIFAAMGSPKQEIFLEKCKIKNNIPGIGLGGSFKIYTGRSRRAPKLFLKLNCEYLYRYLFDGINFIRILKDIKFYLYLNLERIKRAIKCGKN